MRLSHPSPPSLTPPLLYMFVLVAPANNSLRAGKLQKIQFFASSMQRFLRPCQPYSTSMHLWIFFSNIHDEKCPSFSSSSLSPSNFSIQSATRLLLLWLWRVGSCESVDWPRVGPEQKARCVAAPCVLMLDVEAVTSQQLSGHHVEGFFHILTLLDMEKETENFR